MWSFIASFIYWTIALAGISSLALVVVTALLKAYSRLEDEAEEEDRLSSASIAAMEAELIGAVEGSDGRHA